MLESFIVPGVIGIILIIVGICAYEWGDGNDMRWFLPIWFLCGFFVLSVIACPGVYIKSRNKAWQVQTYYENIIQPNIVENKGDTVVIKNLEAGIWQAGEFNLYSYNSYIRTTRYWQEIPILSTIIYPVPKELKFVSVGKQDNE
uniref:Uncharacterized protein n=1 Tax=viral metagenome TaxID=1070528 RepID=A0A6H2A0T8_9ZZZZ